MAHDTTNGRIDNGLIISSKDGGDRMLGNRKRLSDAQKSIKGLIERYRYLRNDFILATAEQPYEDIMSRFETVLKNLEAQIKKLAIGHRYEGDFYIRKSYTTPDEYIKIDNGAIFMREDLVSWSVERGESGETYYGYHRTIYKSITPTMALINREDGKLVYE